MKITNPRIPRRWDSELERAGGPDFTTTVRASVWGAIGIGLLCLWTFTNAWNAPTPPAIPYCQEDEIVMGYGDFAKGRWEHYRCQHPDNFVPGEDGKAVRS